MNTRERRTRQEYALLLSGEYFRDHLETCGGIGEARLRNLETLRNLCFAALGDPTVKDADGIRARYARLAGAGSGEQSDAG